MKKRKDYFEARNSDELLFALKDKESYIIIHKDFKDEFLKKTQLPVTEKEEMAFQLGFNGWAQVFGGVFFHIINYFSKGNKQQKEIDSKLRKYNFKKWNENEIFLYLRELN
ncbi:hypothetical protein [Oceanobacillus saliphilus]|uniref:hypothetical protein n=1 Tax=Oceanobacillus saliphilus TaxID=2925834 RepID=UPI00201E2085|nr:hypothetical protein [Oceanobacillus saliphilus]